MFSKFGTINNIQIVNSQLYSDIPSETNVSGKSIHPSIHPSIYLSEKSNYPEHNAAIITYSPGVDRQMVIQSMNGIPFPECELEKTTTSFQKPQFVTPYKSNHLIKSEDYEKGSEVKPMRIILMEDYQKGRLMN